MPKSEEVPQSAAPSCDELAPGAAIGPRAASCAGVAIASSATFPAVLPTARAAAAVADGNPDASSPAEQMGKLMQVCFPR